MFFFPVLIFLVLPPQTWPLLNCPNCETKIFFNQSIQVPSTCSQFSADFCTLDVHIDFEFQTIDLLFFGARQKDLADDPIFNKSIVYANYFDFQKTHFEGFIGLYCSISDECTIDIAQQQVDNIIKEMSLSVWKDLRLQLIDILVASSDTLSTLTCYTPDTTEEVCSSEINRCYLNHNWHPNKTSRLRQIRSKTEKGEPAWEAGCADNIYADLILRLGYEKYEPSSPSFPDLNFVILYCNKTLCNGGKAIEQMFKLIAHYPAIGGWLNLSPTGIATVHCSYYGILIVVLILVLII